MALLDPRTWLDTYDRWKERKREAWKEHKELAKYMRLFSRKLEIARPEWLDDWNPKTLRTLTRNIKEVEEIVILQERIAAKIIGEDRKEESTIRGVLPKLEARHEARLANMEKQEEYLCESINANLKKLLEVLRMQVVCFDEDRKDVKREEDIKDLASAKKERMALRPKLLTYIRDEKTIVAELNHLISEFMEEIKQEKNVEAGEVAKLLPRLKINPGWQRFGNGTWGLWNVGVVPIHVFVQPSVDGVFIACEPKENLELFRQLALKMGWTEVEGVKLGEAVFAKQGVVLSLFKTGTFGFENSMVIATNSKKIREAPMMIIDQYKMMKEGGYLE